jgi:hypothetical protein
MTFKTGSEEQGHQNVRIAHSAEECEMLLDEQQAETEGRGPLN